MTKRDVLGRYRLIKQISVGETSKVYLAVHGEAEGLERAVLVKCPREDLEAGEEIRRMFQDEARIAASLRHPNIVHLYDLDVEGDLPYLVLEYVFGQDLERIALRARQRNQAVPVEVALAMLDDVLAGLHHAHTLGARDGQPQDIVHRDISPQNILVSFEGVTKLLDFGAAKARDRLAKTQRGALKGKLPYLSPEQIDHLDVDPRSDLFSTAVVFHELLTGTELFQRESEFTTMKAIKACKIPSLTAVRHDLPPGLASALHRALSREPGERFATSKEMRQHLQPLFSPQGADKVAAYLAELFEPELERRRMAIHKALKKERPFLMQIGFDLLGQEVTQRQPRGADTRPPDPGKRPYPDTARGDERSALPLPSPPDLSETDEDDALPAGEEFRDTAPRGQLPPPGDQKPFIDENEATLVVRPGTQTKPVSQDRPFLLRHKWMLPAVLVVVVILVVWIVSGEGDPPDAAPQPPVPVEKESASVLFSQGIQRLKKLDLDGARALMRRVLEKDPNYPGASVMMKRIEKETQAMRLIEQTGDAIARRNWDEALARLSGIPADSIFAEQVSEQRAEVEKKYVELHLDKARRFGDAGLPDKTREHVDAVLEVDPDNAAALDLKKSLPGEQPPAQGEAAVIDLTSDRPDGASQHPTKRRRRQAREKLEKATKLARQKRFGEATGLLEEARRLDPRNCDVYLNLGIVHAMRGTRDKSANNRLRAEKYYRKFVELCPRHLRAPQVRGILEAWDESRR